MPGDLLIDAVRIQSAGQERYVCDLHEPQRVKRSTLLALGAFLAVTLLAALFLSTRHSAVTATSGPEIASLKKFEAAITGIENSLGQSTANFVSQGRSAVLSKDPVAIFDATNRYGDTLNALGRATEHLPLPQQQQLGQSTIWARTAVLRLKDRIAKQRKFNEIVVLAANRAAVDKELFDNAEAAALTLDAEQCQELRIIRRTLQSAGVKPAATAICSSR